MLESPGTVIPRMRSTSSGPLGDQAETSATAGPGLGLTSSTTEPWVAPAPTAVNHWSEVVGPQATATTGTWPERPATNAGASAPVPVTTTGPRPRCTAV